MADRRPGIDIGALLRELAVGDKEPETAEEAAVVLGVTRKTVQADWKVAKMWLRRELG